MVFIRNSDTRSFVIMCVIDVLICFYFWCTAVHYCGTIIRINIIFGNYGEWTRTAIKLVTKLIINEIILVEQLESFVNDIGLPSHCAKLAIVA